jgi:hypothetical protein
MSDPMLKRLERLGYVAVGLALLAGMTACVQAETAARYAKRSHPNCEAAAPVAHRYSMGKDGHSLTEVALTCGGEVRSVMVECSMGVLSDTVCWEPMLRQGAANGQ